MNERDTFAQDQADAAQRDQDAWEANLASAQGDVLMKAAHAGQHEATRNVLNAVASLVNVAWVLSLLAGLVFIAHLIEGWF